MSAPDFLVHGKEDTVGVVVVEDAAKGKTLTGLSMEDGGRISIAARDDIPLGHKIALVDIADGDEFSIPCLHGRHQGDVGADAGGFAGGHGEGG